MRSIHSDYIPDEITSQKLKENHGIFSAKELVTYVPQRIEMEENAKCCNMPSDTPIKFTCNSKIDDENIRTYQVEINGEPGNSIIGEPCSDINSIRMVIKDDYNVYIDDFAFMPHLACNENDMIQSMQYNTERKSVLLQTATRQFYIPKLINTLTNKNMSAYLTLDKTKSAE